MAFFHTVKEIFGEVKQSITLYPGIGAVFEGHKGVLYYDDKVVRVKMQNTVYYAQGEDLCVYEISPSELWVKGEVNSLSDEAGQK